MRCTVLGGGSWGTALAVQLARVGHETVMWDRNPSGARRSTATTATRATCARSGCRTALEATPDLAAAIASAELLVPVVPSHALREVLDAARGSVRPEQLVCCATKGIEDDTLATMCEVCVQTWGGADRGVAAVRAVVRARGRAGHADRGGRRGHRARRDRRGRGVPRRPVPRVPHRRRRRRLHRRLDQERDGDRVWGERRARARQQRPRRRSSPAGSPRSPGSRSRSGRTR